MSNRFKAKVLIYVMGQAARIPYHAIKYHVKRNPAAVGTYFATRFLAGMLSPKRSLRTVRK